MGVISTIDHEKFPKQSEWYKREVSVCFNYDLSHKVDGIVIRDDTEAPFCTIIMLEDSRVVLATECQYTLKK